MVIVIRLFFKVDSKRLRGSDNNEIALGCAKLGVDLIHTSKVKSRRTEWSRFFRHHVHARRSVVVSF